MFQPIQDARVVEEINGAQHRLVFVAPGVSKAVSQALIGQMSQNQGLQVAVILDGDEECCRMGYCDAEALGELHAAANDHGKPIGSQPGLRLCLLMADERVLIWTPTPLMFEAPPGEGQPNGIVLEPSTLGDLPAAVGLDAENSGEPPQIGIQPMEAEAVQDVRDAIKAVPPAPFDLSRLSRVFSSKFQFIETTLKGAELTKREMRLDSLILNSDAPEELRPLLHTTIQPFNTDADRTVDVPVLINGERAFRANGEPHMKATKQADIHAYWDDLSKRYIVNMPGFGRIIRQTDKAKFQAECEAFEEVLELWVKGFKKQVESDHGTRVKRVVDLIVTRMAGLSDKEKTVSGCGGKTGKKGLG
jgi:hypothetical protein